MNAFRPDTAEERILSFFQANPQAKLASDYILMYVVPGFSGGAEAITKMIDAGELCKNTQGLIFLPPMSEAAKSVLHRFAKAVTALQSLGWHEREDGTFQPAA